MKISSRGIDLIKHYEGFRGVPYADAVGVWTIGYGNTRNPYTLEKISKNTPPITEQVATEWLLKHIEDKCEIPLTAWINKNATITFTQGMFDALCSFIYNLGFGNYSNSTMARILSADTSAHDNQIQAASKEFAKWNKAGGTVLSGLTKRREAERQLFLS